MVDSLSPPPPSYPLTRAVDPVVAVDKDHLLALIAHAIAEQGPRASLNHIDVSGITDMSGLFEGSAFNGDISCWDTSQVETMHSMFKKSAFQGDLSCWDVRRVKTMAFMFAYTDYQGDLSAWRFGQLETTGSMFLGAKFNGDVSGWNVEGVQDMCNMFSHCPFNGNLSTWVISESTTTHFMMDLYAVTSYDPPSVFHWEAILTKDLWTGEHTPWGLHLAQRRPLMDVMGLDTVRAQALFLQHAWNALHNSRLDVMQTLALPEMEPT